MLDIPGITSSSGNVEWHTPTWLWDAAALVMNGIDLDPCGLPEFDGRTLATRTHSQKDDGLSRLWSGNVYMNPPWGRGIEKWISRCVTEYKEGRINQAIIACPASTETKWFSQLWDFTICFARGRCFFHDGRTGEVPPKGGPTPVAYVYLGHRGTFFEDVFSSYGAVVIKFPKTPNY